MMKAVVIEKPFYATIVDCATPSIAPNQVLVRVGAVGICASDVEVYEGTRPANPATNGLAQWWQLAARLLISSWVIG